MWMNQYSIKHQIELIKRSISLIQNINTVDIILRVPLESREQYESEGYNNIVCCIIFIRNLLHFHFHFLYLNIFSISIYHYC